MKPLFSMAEHPIFHRCLRLHPHLPRLTGVQESWRQKRNLLAIQVPEDLPCSLGCDRCKEWRKPTCCWADHDGQDSRGPGGHDLPRLPPPKTSGKFSSRLWCVGSFSIRSQVTNPGGPPSEALRSCRDAPRKRQSSSRSVAPFLTPPHFDAPPFVRTTSLETSNLRPCDLWCRPQMQSGRRVEIRRTSNADRETLAWVCSSQTELDGPGNGWRWSSLRSKYPNNLHDSLAVKWRTGWDSNPRYCFQYTRFPGEPVRPLRHLS